jgi:hypothetical protein
VAMVLIGTTYATSAKSQPFIPDNRPRCSLAIMRGAQQAYDAYISSIKRKHDKEEWYEIIEHDKMYNKMAEEYRKNELDVLEKYKKLGEFKNQFKSKMEQANEYRKTELKDLANKKLDEIERYAITKYKCISPIIDDSSFGRVP